MVIIILVEVVDWRVHESVPWEWQYILINVKFESMAWLLLIASHGVKIGPHLLNDNCKK